jgi:localization factor PodJL
MMRAAPAGWSDIDVDPTLRLLAERAARTAGIPVDAWIERAIRRACPQYFETAADATLPSESAGAPTEPARPKSPPQPTPTPAASGVGAALAELIARARQIRSEPQPVAPRQPQFVPPPTPATPATAPFDVAEPTSPSPEAAAPLAARDDDVADQPAGVESAFDSKRQAAAFASEVADWRGHDERPSPVTSLPATDASVAAPYVPFGADADGDAGASLEARNPILAWRSRRPLIIAIGIALAVALGALGTQKFLVERLSHRSPAATAKVAGPTVASSESQPQHAASPSPSSARLQHATSVALPAPRSNPTAAAPQTASSKVAPAPVTSSSPSPPTSVTMAAPTSAAPQPTPRTANETPATQVQLPSPAIPAQPETAAATPPTRPDLPPTLPQRKVAGDKAAPQAQTAAAAREAAAAVAPKDPAILAKWLKEQVEAGNPVAQYRLGVLYALGQGVKQDYSRAAELFKQSAVGGIAEAQYNVAVMYSEGMGVPRDPALAATWYRKAAQQGNANAAFNLGVAYSNGTGVPQNVQEAVRWFRRAAASGVINAQFNLGLLYERGEGVPQSLVEAYAWYAAAAARGDQGAAQRRDHIASGLTPAVLKKAEARAAQLQQMIQISMSPVPTQKVRAASP